MSGDNQTGVVGAALSSPFVVKVTDQNGNPIQNVSVQWTSTAGTFSAASGSTDARGLLSVVFTLSAGPAGAKTAVATVQGIAPVTFNVTATAAAASTISKVSGDAQTGSVGAALASPFTVVVKDASGSGIPNAMVNWVATGGNGASIGATSTTNASGNATATLTLGTVPGAYGATASVTGIATPATFTATATPGAPFTLTKVSGDAQTGTVGTVLPTAFIVQVKDQFGNNVAAGTTVTWAVSGGGTAPSSPTNASGQASTTVTLGTVSGAQTVVATAGTASVTFTTTNNPGAIAGLRKITGDNQTVAVGVAPPIELLASPIDAFGNLVPSPGAVGLIHLAGGTGMSYDLSTQRNDATGFGIHVTAATSPGTATLLWTFSFGSAGPFSVTFAINVIGASVSPNLASRGAGAAVPSSSPDGPPIRVYKPR